MKSSLSPTALNVEIAPSRVIFGALLVIACGAVAAIFYADIPLFARLVLAVLTTAYAGFCWRLQARQRGRLRWCESWLWQPASGSERALQLRAATLWPRLIVLVFRDAITQRSLTFVLWRDSLDDDAARRLRIFLRHARVFETAFET